MEKEGVGLFEKIIDSCQEAVSQLEGAYNNDPEKANRIKRFLIQAQNKIYEASI